MFEISSCGEVVVYEQSEIPGLGLVIFVTAIRMDLFRSRFESESHVFIRATAAHLHEFMSRSVSDALNVETAGNVARRDTHELLAAYLLKRDSILRSPTANLTYRTKILSEPPFSRLRAEGTFRTELSGIQDWTQFVLIRSALKEGICW